mgnify:CR=1 FL=1
MPYIAVSCQSETIMRSIVVRFAISNLTTAVNSTSQPHKQMFSKRRNGTIASGHIQRKRLDQEYLRESNAAGGLSPPPSNLTTGTNRFDYRNVSS